MQSISFIGLDIAKHIFQLHAADERGRCVLKKQLKRAEIIKFFVPLKPCQIGIEACGSAHYWARELMKLGHEVKLISPQFVKPFVKSNKNDAADAAAICEALQRPDMRFVAIKQVAHQEVGVLHSVRSQTVAARVALANSLHGLAAEFGIVLPLSFRKFCQELRQLLCEEEARLPASVKEIFGMQLEQLKLLHEREMELDRRIEALARSNEQCKRLQTIPGVGPITATAVLAQVVDAHEFKNARQFSAWIGLVPKQHSSGGKSVLLGISKRGNVYLRGLLIHGARSMLRRANAENPGRLNQWVLQKKESRGANRATVALANKNARMVWALLKSGGVYQAA